MYRVAAHSPQKWYKVIIVTLLFCVELPYSIKHYSQFIAHVAAWLFAAFVYVVREIPVSNSV